MTQTQQPTRWLTAAEAAEALGVGVDTIYRRAAEGKLTSRKIGSILRIDPAAVFPGSVPVPTARAIDLQPILIQIDIALQQLQLVRQQVSAAIEEGRG